MNKMRAGSSALRSIWKKTKATRRLFSSESDLYLSAKVDVIAHRGASGYMPDHTLPTYKSAFESGSDWIELDAHCTKVSSFMRIR
jgi:glycerophosphoryl diester phosphodiesterase